MINYRHRMKGNLALNFTQSGLHAKAQMSLRLTQRRKGDVFFAALRPCRRQGLAALREINNNLKNNFQPVLIQNYFFLYFSQPQKGKKGGGYPAINDIRQKHYVAFSQITGIGDVQFQHHFLFFTVNGSER